MLAVFAVLCNVLVLVSASNIGRFWHVTDFHYDQTYFTYQLSCNDDVPNPGPYGDYWCDSPWSLVQTTVDFMANASSGPGGVDFIIWTGDTVAHIHDENTSLPENLMILKNVTNLLETRFPGIPVYASLGNHDFYPSDQAEGNKSEIYRAVGDLWKAWISNQSQVDRFENGGFYSKIFSNAKVRLLALNTNLYITSNHETDGVADPADQFHWLTQQLEEARAAGQKVIVTGHVPPGPLTKGLVNWMYSEQQQVLVDILVSYSDVIAGTHFGHDHQDGFKLLQSSDGSKAVPQFTAASVTPWRFRVPTPTGELVGDPHNPTVRLIEYDRDTGAHLDYHQYFINLTDTNSNKRANWAKLYSFKAAYSVPDMSVDSMRTIFERIKDGGGRTYTTRYCRYALASQQNTPCTDETRGEIYCAGLYYKVPEAKACVAKYLKRINNGDRGVCGTVASESALRSIGPLYRRFEPRHQSQAWQKARKPEITLL
ncbi:acid sphingomyelinase-like phosphodiesterase 3b [Plakobranchus ocellatus]|uniref:Acid sphingomyelinase-like phosphodiesterase 3b n=1 Tax=Plakobranchus ocellatus TaxID=259542 RepID=A0AAV3Z4K3_9GAST|nr:acid sphingomyelinase-like phosphodiesterase 3b [Plakobranchus ocellatus]